MEIDSPSDTQMEKELYKPYTGIGSRSTPASLLPRMTMAANILFDAGYTLRSGGANGADTAFELGAGRRKEIFVPQPGFNIHKRNYPVGDIYIENPDLVAQARDMASYVHPNWAAASKNPFALRAHTRNVFQILGPQLDSPTEFVILWAPPCEDGVLGGTNTAYKLALLHSIPTYNVYLQSDRLALRKLLHTIRGGE